MCERVVEQCGDGGNELVKGWPDRMVRDEICI